MAGRAWLARAVAAVLLYAPVAGCGTMLGDEEFVAAEGAVRQVSGSGGGGATGAGTGSGTGAGGATGTAGQAGTADQVVGGDAGTAGSAGSSDGATAGGTGDAAAGGAATGGAASGPNQASDVGVTETSIKIGNITAVSGALGPDAFTPYYRGAKLYFDVINQQGGINGRKVEFITCDDSESPSQDLACAQRLIEQEGVFALAAGSTDTYSAASYVNGQGVPDVGSIPIGNAYYKYPYLFAVTGSEGYPRDGSQLGQGGLLYAQSAIYRYFKNQVGVTAAGVMYYSIAISKTAGEFIAHGLEIEGIPVRYKPAGGGGSLPTQQSYDSDVVAMREAGVDGIWNAIDIGGFQKLCRSMDRLQFTVKANVSTVQGWSQKVGRDFSSPCRTTVFANGQSAGYGDTSNPLVAEIVGYAQQFDPGGYLHQWVIDGWIGAKMLADAIASMGAAPTRQGVVDWLNAQSDYTAGGLIHPKGVDWQPSKDFSVPDNDCFTLGRWDDGAGTFVNALSGETFHCETSAYYSYIANDDGS